MKFILSRTNDSENHSKKWIVGYGLSFWLISRIFAGILLICCVAIYKSQGMDPETLTKFAGSPTSGKALGSSAFIFLLLSISIVAPLMEECIFRLGLSFKKWQLAIAAAAIPAYLLWQFCRHLSILGIIVYIVAIIAAFCVVYYLTSDTFWQRLKQTNYKSAIWGTAIAFGLIHLIAFSHYSLELIPYMLCVISVPFFTGCAITYYRVNLGFWWGVALHIFNNIPGILSMLLG